MNDKNPFQIIPETDVVEKLDRRLVFHPADAEDPATLTRRQVRDFNEGGCLLGIRIFDDEQIRGLRRYFDELLERTLAGGADSYSISTAHLKHAPVYDVLTDARIVNVVKDLLGPDVVAWGSHFFCKMPRDGRRVAWHQDASYWPLSPAKTVTVWLAIDDVDMENGGMRFIRGSHRFGHLTYRASRADENNVLDQTVENAEDYGTRVDVPLRAGEVSIHCDLLLHGSEANDSDRRRCGLTLRYCAAEVRAELGWNAKGIVVSGRDPDGHWANPPRPLPDSSLPDFPSPDA
jgi:Phytanoyl-CoA dioxygenase (PhyH)